MRIAVAAIALVAASAASAALQAQTTQPRRALQIEDYYRIQTVGSPSISPDGRWVTYSVATRVEDDNSTRTEHWVVPTTGTGTPHRLLHYGRDITNPRWGDDSRIVYSADRAEWAIDPERAPAAPPEPRTRTAPGTIPAGDSMITLRDRPQPASAPAAATDFERRHQERFKGAIFDWKDFQRDGQPFPAPNLRIRPAADIVIRKPDGSEQVITAGDVRPGAIAASRDGSRIVFTADPDWRDELRYESPDLWLADATGKVTRLTDDGNVYSSPEFSPDGQWIAFVRDPGTDLIISEKRNHGGPSDLYVMPVDSGASAASTRAGQAINLTAGWDLEPDNPRWAPDGKHIYFTATIGGASHLFSTTVPDGHVTQVTTGARRLNGITIDRAFTRIAYTVGVHDAPPEVHTARIDGSDERRLTAIHRPILSVVAFSPTERLAWASPDGTKIEGWLTLPHAYAAGRTYPLIVTSHGGPHAAAGYSFDFKKQFFAANGYFVLDTNFRSSTGYGEAFKWATWGAWGDKDGQDVIAGIDHVLKAYPIDPARVGHMGHSYGGFMTNWLITQYPDRFAAAISGAGISNWISDYGTADIYRTKETEFFGTPWEAAARDRMIRQSPITYAGVVKTPTLFVHGEVDQRVPYEEAEQLYFALKRRGIPAKMIQYQGQPHGIGGHWNNVHRMLNELAWWEKYLKPVKTATSNSQLPN